ncbi:cupin domain-containing protein [Methylobacterium sp. A54F]
MTRTLTLRTHAALAAALLVLGTLGATAQDGHGAAGLVVVPEGAAVRYQPGPPNLPKGTQIGLVSGDPAKPGPFVLRVKVPAGTVIAPHIHAQAETLTILAGSIHHSHGPTLDRAAGSVLRTGGFVFLPQDMPHALWTTDEPVELQVNGSGPFGLSYVNPEDDPSRSAGR